MTSEIYLTPTGHAKDCDWHADQYPWECTCGFIPRKKAMDNLIAQDADQIVLDDPGLNKPANTLVRDMSRAIHKVLSKDNIDAYLMMSRDVAGDAARAVVPFIKADRIEALEAENERLRGALRLLLEDYLGIYPNDTAYTTISLVDPETEPAVIEARAALGDG